MNHGGFFHVVILAIAASLIVLVGLITLYSFEAINEQGALSFFSRQVIFAIVGFFVAFFFSRFSYRSFQMASTPLYFSAIGILLFVLFLGNTIRGTAGWIDLGLVSIQPVEIVKVILILFLASFFVAKRRRFGELGRSVISFSLVLILVGLVLMQPDFGSAMILLIIWAGMLFVSDMRARYVFAIIFLGVCTAIASWFFLADYQKDRIVATIRPEIDAQGSGYNVIQSMIAIGSGGFMGKGVGLGTQSQLLFLPERHTDFIFASVVESLGFVGAVFLLVLYGIILHRIAKIAMTAADSFGFLIASGVYSMLFAQIIINIGMNIGLVPVTGIPLPLLSYGGSSLFATAIGLGIVANIAHQRRIPTSDTMDDLLDDRALS